MLIPVAASWLPLLVLTAIEGRLLGEPRPFISDFATHARLLIALPALLIGRDYTNRAVIAAVNYLAQVGIVSPDRQEKYRSHLAKAATLRDSWPASVAAVVIAYAFTALELRMALDTDGWRGARATGVSIAGFWYFAVARPLVFTQILMCFWSFAVWVVLFVRMIRLPLRLLAYHPDHFGGLGPVLHAHETFALLSFALGTDLAGALVNRIVHAGESLALYRASLAVSVVALTLTLLAPLLLFVPALFEARLRATLEQGTVMSLLATRLHGDFQRTLQSGISDPVLRPVLEAQAKVGEGAQLVMGTHRVPFNRHLLLSFVLAPILPIALAACAQVPPRQLLSQLLALLTLGRWSES